VLTTRLALEALSIHISAYGTRPDGVLFRNPHDLLWRRGAVNSCARKPTLVLVGLPTSIVETMDSYGHLFPDQNDETTAALDR
jgi:hypothetical protein